MTRSNFLPELISPAHTAVLTMELQRGVIGDLAAFGELREAASEVRLPANAGKLCAAARAAGVRVVHCNAAFRSDRQGSADNCRLLSAAEKRTGGVLDVGHPGTDNIAELDVQSSDLVVERSHGLTPFVATELDQLLRNMGVETVVAIGASLNVGLLGMVMGAVDLGYQVVVPADAVVGVPVQYGESVLAHTVGLLATVVVANDLVEAWS